MNLLKYVYYTSENQCSKKRSHLDPMLTILTLLR